MYAKWSFSRSTLQEFPQDNCSFNNNTDSNDEYKQTRFRHSVTNSTVKPEESGFSNLESVLNYF
eukprot:44322-Rhodomonas_salina.1